MAKTHIPVIRNVLTRSFHRSVTPAIGLAIAAIVIAAFAGAILLYDGGWFLFHVLDQHRITIPQLRISFAQLLWPAVWIARNGGSFDVVRLGFSLSMMATPPIAIAISWWFVRKQAPWLIVWPALGIFLIDLPGQMHWIATSIRTNQLFWPLLLAVFLGMPDRVLPISAILFVFILFMHPQVSAFLLAGAAAALFLSFQRRDQRERLRATAMVFTFGAMYRYGILEAGYERQEASLSNQIGQWQRSVQWLPLVLIIATLVVALLLVVFRNRDHLGRYGIAALGATGLTAFGAMIWWASDVSLWRHAIDYRGPSMWHSLVLMGIAFIDVALRGAKQTSPTSMIHLRTAIANCAAIIFAVVIALQSFGWHQELNKVRALATESDRSCIRTSSIEGFETSPLNFWSLPAASIGMQSGQPDFVVLPDHLCDTAENTGVIPMDLTKPKQDFPGRWVDLFQLRVEITQEKACRAEFISGWHAPETEHGNYRRWAMSTGVIHITMAEAGTIELRGVLDSYDRPNEVKIRVNGMVQRNIVIEGDRYADLEGISLQLQAGVNVIEIAGMRPPAQPDGDPRELTVSVINLEFRISDTGEACSWYLIP